MKKRPNIIGKYFHSFPQGKLTWQGQVLNQLAPGKYLVQLYEWFLGGLSDELIVSIDRMVDEKWNFYSHVDDWRDEANRIQLRNERLEKAQEEGASPQTEVN
jgi:hypothetical protein